MIQNTPSEAPFDEPSGQPPPLPNRFNEPCPSETPAPQGDPQREPCPNECPPC